MLTSGAELMDELMLPLGLLDAPSPASVLVVDDNAGKRLAVRAMLAPLGHAVVEVDSGRAALLAIEQQSFAVILMDVSMPILDGYETARLIRERIESATTPIIFLTAYGRDETETASAYASGAVDFIFTPVLADVLRAKVAAFIHLFVQSRELQRSLESITALNGALREGEARTRAVLQNVADGIVTADEAGLIESFNRSAQRLFGYKEHEVIGQPLRLIIAPNENDASSDLATTEAVGRRQDGSCFPMEIGTSLVNVGERMLTIGCVRDISARNEQAEREREREHALRRDAQRDRVAFEAAPIGGIITGRDGTIERVNQAMCDMTGYTADELIGMDSSRLAHPDERQHSAAVIDASEWQVGTERFEKRYLHSSGRTIEAQVALTTICDDHDKVMQLFGQIEDVTEARRTSRELEQAQFEMLARLAAAAEFRDDDTGTAHAPRRRPVGHHRPAPGAARHRGRADPPRRAAARRRQDRDPRRHPGQAGQADRRRVRRDEDPHHHRCPDARRGRVRAARDGRGDRADPPREMGRQRLPRRPGRRGDPDRRAHRRGRRRLRRAHPFAAVQAGLEQG